MSIAIEITRWASVLAFLGFGLSCLGSRRMVVEFERYGLARFRVLVGLLEVAGALGLAAGVVWPWLTTWSAAGLSLLMVLGVLTRVRIRDSLVQTAPAFVLMVMNAALVVSSLGAAR